MNLDQEKSGRVGDTLPQEVCRSDMGNSAEASVGNIAALGVEVLPMLPINACGHQDKKIANLYRLPEEMRARRQWCVAGPDQKGTFKAPYVSDMLRMASVTDPSHWTDFQTAVTVAHNLGGGHGVGYVISADDPFTIIDMDVKDDTPQERLNQYWQFAQEMDCYTELSTSGRGLHIVTRGSIGKGCRRDGIEVYSQERFIVCTGNVLIDSPIRDSQDELDNLVLGMRHNDPNIVLEEVEQELEDMEIVEKLSNAVNGDKFNELCRGDWKGMGYPSQSEADLALMSMFCFYSKSNEQCRNLFRMTALGKRDKATRNNDYLNNTLKVIRGRQANENVRIENAKVLGGELLKQLRATCTTQSDHLGNPIESPSNAAPTAPVAAQLAWPPGVAGGIARIIFSAAMRPVCEVSIVATLGLLAGVCGKRWTIPKSGLNLYLVLLAKSGIGKEAMHEGISMFIHAARAKQPEVEQYFDFSEYASGQALTKAAAERSSFLQVSSEFGRKLKRMSETSDRVLQDLRTTMTKLYSKSGPQAMAGGIAYSDKERNVRTVSGVAYSMIGDSTPTTFRDALTGDMMEDGFMSRFTVIEHSGDRPPANPNPQICLSEDWAGWFAGLVTHSLSLERNNVYQHVSRDSEAEQLLDAFNLKCDLQIIKAGDDESKRQMWNRAHLKALRISALLAVADNYVHPCITQIHAEWAIDLVLRDISTFAKRLKNGEVGSDDVTREKRILTVIKEYLLELPTPGYKIPPVLHQNQIIPKRYIAKRISSSSAFNTHRLGAATALDQVLRSLCSSGYIAKCSGADMAKNYNEHGECYIALHLPQED